MKDKIRTPGLAVVEVLFIYGKIIGVYIIMNGFGNHDPHELNLAN